jgi:hypothetical protein
MGEPVRLVVGVPEADLEDLAPTDHAAPAGINDTADRSARREGQP